MKRTVVIFLFIWFLAAVFINSGDQRNYGLQQAMVEALVEHGGFELGLSKLPVLRPRGDTFQYEGRILPAKQPGQGIVGAISYSIMYKLGLSYEKNFTLTSSLVTFFSSTLFASLAAVFLYLLVHRLSRVSHANSEHPQYSTKTA